MEQECLEFCLSFRPEGEFWNAYVARRNSTDGAILIGSIVLAAAEDKLIRAEFVALMKSATTARIKALFGAVIATRSRRGMGGDGATIRCSLALGLTPTVRFIGNLNPDDEQAEAVDEQHRLDAQASG
jgi:hypothetical protein